MFDDLQRIAVVGMFDGVHSGHRYLLDQLRLQAAERSLKPLVITFTNHPLAVIAPEKAPRLLTSPLEKAALIRREGFLGDEILLLPFDEKLRSTSAAGFLGMLRGRFGCAALLMGFNNRFGHDAPSDFASYKQLAANAGIELIQARELPAREGVSSSEIRRLIAAGEVADAAALLGRPYSLTGTVVRGKALGRTLGFPTANLHTPSTLILPAPGVYAATATIAPPPFSSGTNPLFSSQASSETNPGAPFPSTVASRKASSKAEVSYPAMVNIGSRPTVDDPGAPLSVEAHIIGLPEGTNLYDCRLTLSLVDRLRSERRFASLEALRAQLLLDRAAALEALEGLSGKV